MALSLLKAQHLDSYPVWKLWRKNRLKCEQKADIPTPETSKPGHFLKSNLDAAIYHRFPQILITYSKTLCIYILSVYQISTLFYRLILASVCFSGGWCYGNNSALRPWNVSNLRSSSPQRVNFSALRPSRHMSPLSTLRIRLFPPSAIIALCNCVMSTREFSQETAKNGGKAVLMILAMTIHETGTIAGKPGHRAKVAQTGTVPVKPGRLECLRRPIRYGFHVSMKSYPI